MTPAPRRRPPKLRTRITASFFLVLVLWSGLLLAAFTYMLSQSSRRFYREREGVHLVRSLMTECLPLVLYDDLAGLASLFDQQMKSIPYTRYVAVLDSENRPVWSTFPNGVPADLLAVRHESQPDGDVSVRLIRTENGLTYDYETKRSGITLRLGLSLAPIQAFMRRTYAFAAGAGAIGLVAVLGMALYVSRPLERLSRTIERAVLLDRKTGGPPLAGDTLEASTITRGFEELMDRLEARTRQLDSAKKLAYLGEISATIAHEVNNPLGILTMNAEFLSRRIGSGELGTGAATEVKRMEAASKRATLAAQKLLQFAKYATRRDQVRFRPTDLGPLIRDCLDLVDERLRLSRCTLRVEIPADLPKVTCDEQGLQQVLFNLVTNAVDASPEGGEITVSLELGGSELTLRVSDRGEGMSEEVLRRAKEPFFTTKEQGLGVGLAISNSIVLTHKGSLALEPRPGGGSIATVRLPAQMVS